MAGVVYYIPGAGASSLDLIVETARGRVDLSVGPASDTPAGTVALIVGPGVDPAPALNRLATLRLVQLTTCDNPFIDAFELERTSLQVSTISPAVADTIAGHAIGLALGAMMLPTTAGHRTRDEIAAFTSDLALLTGKQVGIIGMGELGSAVARRLAGSGAGLVYSDVRTAQRRSIEGIGMRRSSLDLLLTQSDVIIVTARWGPTANPLLGRRDLRLPDSGAVLVNAADSRLIDEPALHTALSTGQMKGAAFGVPVGPSLSSHPNIIAAPLELEAHHLAAAAELVVSNLERLAANEPIAGRVEPIDYPAAGDPAFWSSRLYPHRAR